MRTVIDIGREGMIAIAFALGAAAAMRLAGLVADGVVHVAGMAI